MVNAFILGNNSCSLCGIIRTWSAASNWQHSCQSDVTCSGKITKL